MRLCAQVDLDFSLTGVGKRGSVLEGEESEACFLRKGSIWMGSMNLHVDLKHCIETRASALTGQDAPLLVNKLLTFSLRKCS